MTYRYTIIMKVQREGLLTVPVADFHVEGRLDPEKGTCRDILIETKTPDESAHRERTV